MIAMLTQIHLMVKLRLLPVTASRVMFMFLILKTVVLMLPRAHMKVVN